MKIFTINTWFLFLLFHLLPDNNFHHAGCISSSYQTFICHCTSITYLFKFILTTAACAISLFVPDMLQFLHSRSLSTEGDSIWHFYLQTLLSFYSYSKCFLLEQKWTENVYRHHIKLLRMMKLIFLSQKFFKIFH